MCASVHTPTSIIDSITGSLQVSRLSHSLSEEQFAHREAAASLAECEGKMKLHDHTRGEEDQRKLTAELMVTSLEGSNDLLENRLRSAMEERRVCCAGRTSCCARCVVTPRPTPWGAGG